MVMFFLAVPLYMSTATTLTWCVPAASENERETMSFHSWNFFTPSIQISMRMTPAGELPLALMRTGEATLAFAAGVQIFAARFADDGGAQITVALVLISSSQPPFSQEETARS